MKGNDVREDRAKVRKKKKIKFWIKVLVFLTVCGMVGFLFKAPVFKVKTFQVQGNGYYTSDEIITMGNCKKGGNIFIGTDCRDIENRLKKDSYMEEVKVSRKLPNTILISLKERQQTAAIVYGSKFVVIDRNGIVLRKTSVEPKITILRGLTISKLAVGEKVEIEESVLFRQAMEILHTMLEQDMYFQSIEMFKGRVEGKILKKLVCKGSAQSLVESMENNGLQLVVENLLNRGIERGTIKISGENYVSFTPKVD